MPYCLNQRFWRIALLKTHHVYIIYLGRRGPRLDQLRGHLEALCVPFPCHAFVFLLSGAHQRDELRCLMGRRRLEECRLLATRARESGPAMSVYTSYGKGKKAMALALSAFDDHPICHQGPSVLSPKGLVFIVTVQAVHMNRAAQLQQLYSPSGIIAVDQLRPAVLGTAVLDPSAAHRPIHSTPWYQQSRSQAEGVSHTAHAKTPQASSFHCCHAMVICAGATHVL